MSKCKHCTKKKGKRHCPALSGPICPLCCGKHRQKEIKCTEDCPFLEGNAEYNMKKQMDFFGQSYVSFCRGLVHKHSENAAELLYKLDASSLTYYVKNGKSTKDREIIDGWEYLLNRADSSLIVTDEVIGPFADFLTNKSNNAVHKLIRESEELKEPLKEYLQFIKDSSGDTEGSKFTSVHRRYLESITTKDEMDMIVNEYSTVEAQEESTDEKKE